MSGGGVASEFGAEGQTEADGFAAVSVGVVRVGALGVAPVVAGEQAGRGPGIEVVADA